MHWPFKKVRMAAHSDGTTPSITENRLWLLNAKLYSISVQYWQGKTPREHMRKKPWTRLFSSMSRLGVRVLGWAKVCDYDYSSSSLVQIYGIHVKLLTEPVVSHGHKLILSLVLLTRLSINFIYWQPCRICLTIEWLVLVCVFQSRRWWHFYVDCFLHCCWLLTSGWDWWQLLGVRQMPFALWNASH